MGCGVDRVFHPVPLPLCDDAMVIQVLIVVQKPEPILYVTFLLFQGLLLPVQSSVLLFLRNHAASILQKSELFHVLTGISCSYSDVAE